MKNLMSSDKEGNSDGEELEESAEEENSEMNS
jgi:hypothetical protein